MKKKKRGFTLIELLVTLAIIAIITTITVVVINNINNTSNDVVVKVNTESLSKAAITYVQEFKMNDWEQNASTEEYVCISVNQLKNKGYFKGKLVDENNISIDNATLKVTRNVNKVISNEVALNSTDCIYIPTVEMKVEGTTTLYNGNNWYYKKEDASITLKLNRELGYFPINLTYNGENIDTNKFEIISGTDYEYKLNLSDINNIENYSGETGEVEIKVNVGAGDNIATDSEIIYADFKRPTKPVLTSDDNVTSGNWHETVFTLNTSGGDSPSGNYYMYGYSSDRIDTKVQNKIENIDNTISKTVYVKTCNNLNICSDQYETYKIITKPAVTLLIEGPTKSYNDKEWYYDSVNTIIKLVVTSENNSFTKTLKIGNETVNLTNVTPSNNTYIYSVKLSDVSNIKNYGEDTNINASITLNGKTIPATKTINVDFITPSKPTLTASDELASGKWHAEEFTLNISGGGTSPSGTYYMYGYDKSTINVKVAETSIPVSENGSFNIYVKTCNNIGTCSSYTEYKTIKSVTLISGRLEINFAQYFEDSTISFKDVKFEEGDTKVSKIYYLINTNGKKPKTIEEFVEANPTNSTKYDGEIQNYKTYYGRIGVVDTAGNFQVYRVGYASPGAKREVTTVESEYEYWAQYNDSNEKIFAWVAPYDNPSGKLLSIKDFKFENNRLEYTVLSTGATAWNAAGGSISADVTYGTVSGCMNSNLSSSWSCPHEGSIYKIDGKWQCVYRPSGTYASYLSTPPSYCYDNYGNKVDNCSTYQQSIIATSNTTTNYYLFYTYPKYTNVGCKCTSDTIGKKPTEFVYDAGSCPLYSEELTSYGGSNYPNTFENNCPKCETVGTDYGVGDYYIKQLTYCKWNDYDAVCKTPTYSCPSGTAYQDGEYCYSCDVGTLDTDTLMCNYTKQIKYKYYIWAGYYTNEIVLHSYTYGG